MSRPSEFLWYIPNQVAAGHRGDPVTADHNSLDTLTTQARALEDHGWHGALLGTGWGRPDTFTVAAALAARTTTFEPLIAIRPGYWRPANFASAAATLDHLSGGRVRVNIVSGQDNLAAYGDSEGDQAHRYARTQEFMRLVRRLWTEENVTFAGEHFWVTDSHRRPASGGARRPQASPALLRRRLEAAERVVRRPRPTSSCSGASRSTASRERIDRLKALSKTLDRDLPPLEFGLRITTLVRDTTEQAWADAEAKVAQHGRGPGRRLERSQPAGGAVGQQRLLDLQQRGRGARRQPLHRARQVRRRRGGHHLAGRLGGRTSPVRCASTATWASTHFVLSDTPYLSGDQAAGRPAAACCCGAEVGLAVPVWSHGLRHQSGVRHLGYREPSADVRLGAPPTRMAGFDCLRRTAWPERPPSAGLWAMSAAVESAFG